MALQSWWATLFVLHTIIWLIVTVKNIGLWMNFIDGLCAFFFCYWFFYFFIFTTKQREWLRVCNCNFSCSRRKTTISFMSDLACTLKQMWSQSKYCEHLKSFGYTLYPGEDLQFFLWVSGDWQEVERNIMQHWYENTQPRRGEIMRKRKLDWWTISLCWFSSLLEIVLLIWSAEPLIYVIFPSGRMAGCTETDPG